MKKKRKILVEVEEKDIDLLNNNPHKFWKKVKKIGDNCFNGIQNINEIEIPKAVQEIGIDAFFCCNQLSSVIFNEGLKKIGREAFFSCKKLDKIEIPKTVSEIGLYAFSESAVKEVVLCEGLKKIREGAFRNCKNIEKVEIPSTVELIGGEAFCDDKNVKEVILNEGIKEIGYRAFFSCSNLEKVEIPSTVTRLGKSSFSSNENLKEVVLHEGLKEIGVKAFENNDGIRKIEIPSSVETLGSYVFSGCLNLREVKLNEGLKEIGNYAFETCISNKKIEVPSSVKDIGESAFYANASLKEVILNEGLEKIHMCAFSDCGTLERVEIPSTVEKIGAHAFSNCKSLNEMIIPVSVTTIGEHFVDGLDNMYLSKLNDQDSKYPKGIIISKEIPTNPNVEFTYKWNDVIGIVGNESEIVSDILQEGKITLDEEIEKINNYLVKHKIKLPVQFIKKLKDNDEIENFINNTHFKNFKRIMKLISNNLNPVDAADLYTFAYNIGCLSKDLDLNNQANTWLMSNIVFSDANDERKLSVYKMHSNFGSWQPKGENEEFSKFLFGKDPQKKETTFSEAIKHYDFGQLLKRIYNEYQNEEIGLLEGGRFRDPDTKKLKFKFNRYSINENGERISRPKELEPTFSLFMEYFDSIKFSGVSTKEDKLIADELGKWSGLKQDEFDDAKEIMIQYKQNKIKNNIVGKHLKNVANEINEYNNQAKKLAEEGVKCAQEILVKLSNVVNEEFAYDWLEKNDPTNFVLGLYCNCCASLSGVGYGIMKSNFVHPDVQNLVIRDKNGTPVAKSTIYVNRKEGYALFNNVEVSHISLANSQKIYEEYMKGVEAFANEYNKRNPLKPLKKINVGIHYNDLEEEIKKGRKPSSILKGINFGEYGKKIQDYEGDWSKGDQYTLWENKELKRKGKR